MMESFWARMQVELLNRQVWKTRIELASSIHDYIELWHNTRRRHSALAMQTPAEAEAAWFAENSVVAEVGGARTTPTEVVDEHAGSGLSNGQTEPLDLHQIELIQNND